MDILILSSVNCTVRKVYIFFVIQLNYIGISILQYILCILNNILLYNIG